MNNFLGSNIRHLRKSKNLTQDQLADKLGVKRAMIGSYEEGRATPKIHALQTISHYFNVSIDDMINMDLKTENLETENQKDISGADLRILTTIVDRDNKEMISLVPVKASAGYTTGYSDPDFIDSLPKFALPLPELSQERTYRAFQISGNSMEPIPSGAYIICEYLQDWTELKEGKPHILITKDDGVVYKRIFKNDDNTLLLKSDNPEYDPYNISLNNITEVWKALGYISFNLPETDQMSLNKLTSIVYKMQGELDELRKG